MKLKKTSIRIAVIALLLGLLFFSLKYFFFSPTPPEYLTAPVIRMDIEDVVLASGTIQPIQYVNVGAQVTGQLKTLAVKLGDHVKKGQLLAEIDPVIAQNDLRKAQSTLAQVQAQTQLAKASLTLHEATLARQQTMFSHDATSRADLEHAQAQVARTLAELAIQKALTQHASIGIEIAKANLGYTRITAPMDGEIISIVTQEGQTVVSSQAAPVILVMANLDTMTVKAQISEADVIRAKPGLPVHFTTLGASGRRFSSTLRVVEPMPEYRADNTSAIAVYYNGLFDVPNPKRLLRSSMTAQVSIVLKQVKQVLAIPITALGKKNAEDAYEVHVLDQHHQPHLRLIKTGLSDHIHIEVLDGLQEGEKIVVGDSSQLDTTTSISVMF